MSKDLITVQLKAAVFVARPGDRYQRFAFFDLTESLPLRIYGTSADAPEFIRMRYQPAGRGAPMTLTFQCIDRWNGDARGNANRPIAKTEYLLVAVSQARIRWRIRRAFARMFSVLPLPLFQRRV